MRDKLNHGQISTPFILVDNEFKSVVYVICPFLDSSMPEFRTFDVGKLRCSMFDSVLHSVSERTLISLEFILFESIQRFLSSVLLFITVCLLTF